jgi:hypothetical protein
MALAFFFHPKFTFASTFRNYVHVTVIGRSSPPEAEPGLSGEFAVLDRRRCAAIALNSRPALSSPKGDWVMRSAVQVAKLA